MKKYKNYILTIAGAVLFLLLILFYFLFQAPFTAWNLIPNSAMLVIETTNLPRAYKDLQQKTLWKNIQDDTYTTIIKTKFQYFIKNVEEASAKIEFWEEKRVTLSLHWVGKEDFDALFIIPLTSKTDQQIYQQFVGKLQHNQAITFRQRDLSAYTITEIKNKETEERFSFLLYKGYWVGSFSSLLIEDVVRKLDTGESAYSFAQANELKNQLTKSPLSNSYTEAYLNFPRLAEGISKVLPEHLQQTLKTVSDWGTQTYLRLNPTNPNGVWEGYTFAHQQQKRQIKGLAFLKNQQGKAFSMAHLIPQNAYLVYTLSLDKPQALAENLPILRPIVQHIEGDIALVHLSAEGKDEGSLLCLKVLKPVPFLASLAKEGITLGEREQVGSYALQSVNGWDKLQVKLKINGLAHFKQAYFALVGQYVIVGNDHHALRQCLQDYQQKKTWQTLPAYQAIAPTLKKTSNFTMIAYPPLLWGKAYEWVNPKFQMLMSLYEGQIKAMNWVVWQNNTNGSSFDTHLQTFPQAYKQNNTSEDTIKGDYAVRSLITFGELLYTQPYLVQNFETKETEILVQDFRNNLFLLNEKGQVLWKRNMGTAMIGSPTQIDIYNNNRLQYLWATGNRLHLIDKLGRNVPGFPVGMTDSTNTLQGVSVLDAQQNKDYLFTGCDERGRVFVLSKKVQWVAGWSPKRLAYRLGTPLQVVRVKDVNYNIAVQENGQIHAFKATGEELTGFPITIKQRFTAQMHIEAGATLTTTYVTTVSEDGKLIQFNLAGKVLKELQLYRPSGKARFTLLQDSKKDNCWFTVSTETYWQLMDRNGNKLIEDEVANGSGKWDIQLFEPIAGKHLLAVTNKGEGKTSLYDMLGKLISEPFNSNTPIALRYDNQKKQLLIYRVLGNKLSILAMNYATFAH